MSHVLRVVVSSLRAVAPKLKKIIITPTRKKTGDRPDIKIQWSEQNRVERATVSDKSDMLRYVNQPKLQNPHK